MTVEAVILTENIPEHLRDLAQKWSEAVGAALGVIQKPETTEDDVNIIIDIMLHSVGAVIAPGDLGPTEFNILLNRFAQAIANVSAAFAEDKQAAEATKQ